ncbi:MAG TPA: DinB family protein [Candidatus Acidoferrales bacterium]|nr:DinB family protein [Candidatus Acidoferrales bacterium]
MGNETQAVMAPAAALTSAELDFAAAYLAVTRDRLEEALKDLSEAQWNFKPSRERWSIAENMEHIAIVEGRVQEIIKSMEQAPAEAPGRDVKQVDAAVLVAVSMRHPKYKAPDRISPLGGRTGRQALQDFLANRARTAALLSSSPNLRGRVVPHPILGPWDGYQWILAAGAHSARHTGQVLEVKEEPNFPAH